MASTSTLKNIYPSQIPVLASGRRSDVLHGTAIPAHEDARDFYLSRAKAGSQELPPPLTSCSDFVPRSLVTLLMRRKKDSALGVKFVPEGGFRTIGREVPDEITDMEGALHSFVTPVLGVCEMVGDYKYSRTGGGHGVVGFGYMDKSGRHGQGDWRDRVLLARTVVLSASIQLDFEGTTIMLRVCKLDATEVLGIDLLKDPHWRILSTEHKHDDSRRRVYDDALRKHMVHHLTRAGKLPARKDVQDAMSFGKTIQFLEDVILWEESPAEKMVGKFAELRQHQVVSLELLFNSALHQVRNEFSALEAVCPMGYVYTYDPASIFAGAIGAPILNRLMLVALKHASDRNSFRNLRLFAFNNYADKDIMPLVAKALEKQSNAQVIQKDALFKGPGGTYDITNFPTGKAAMLVVHNNSDGFGQNIETEHSCGSLDGAIGASSSAAASLERGRKDLLTFVC